MSWKQKVGAIAGAVIGLIAGRLAVSAMFDGFGEEPAIPASWGLPEADRERLSAGIEEGMLPLTEEPRFHAYLRDTGAASSSDPGATARLAGQELVHLGLRHLSTADLEVWNRLRLRLAASSEELCAGLWTGVVPDPALGRGLASLNDDELREWFAVSARAARHRLDNLEGPLTPPDAAFDAGFAAIGERLPPAERARFEGSVANPNSSAADACWLTQTVLGGAGELPVPIRHTFLRALASI